jgi:hypothetical protein
MNGLARLSINLKADNIHRQFTPPEGKKRVSKGCVVRLNMFKISVAGKD